MVSGSADELVGHFFPRNRRSFEFEHAVAAFSNSQASALTMIY